MRQEQFFGELRSLTARGDLASLMRLRKKLIRNKDRFLQVYMPYLQGHSEKFDPALIEVLKKIRKEVRIDSRAIVVRHPLTLLMSWQDQIAVLMGVNPQSPHYGRLFHYLSSPERVVYRRHLEEGVIEQFKSHFWNAFLTTG